MESKLASLPSTSLAKRVEFTCDWQGRRIRKLVKNSSLEVISDTRFVYGGHGNIVALGKGSGATWAAQYEYGPFFSAVLMRGGFAGLVIL